MQLTDLNPFVNMPRATVPRVSSNSQPERVALDEPQFGASFNWSQRHKRNRFFRAVRQGDLQRVKQYINDKVVDVNERGDDDVTPLMQAAEFNHTAVVRFLLNSGADPKLKSKMGMSTALISAVAFQSNNPQPSNRAEVLRLLADKSDVNHRDARHRTAAFHAAKNGLTAAMEVLIENNADVTLPGPDGLTTLMYAAWNGEIEMLDHILAATPKEKRTSFVNAKNQFGRSALDIARSTGRKEVAARLVAAGAKASPMVLEWIGKPELQNLPSMDYFIDEYLKDRRQ